MKTIEIQLPTVSHVQRFVNTLASLKGDFELISGQYVLDARSLMGIFGFDLSKPLCLKIYDDTPETMAALSPYLVDLEGTHHE